MNRVLKYPFPLADRVTLEMPCGAEILTVAIQNGLFCLWARVDVGDPEAMVEISRDFRVFGTGQVWREEVYEYVGTVFDGGFVWHVFEVWDAAEGGS